MRRISGPVILFLLLASYALSMPGPVARVESAIWEIGKFDRPSVEFNPQVSSNDPNYNPTYTVGRSMAKDWPYWQPGSQNQAFGGKAHPDRTLSRANNPPTAFTVRVAVIPSRKL